MAAYGPIRLIWYSKAFKAICQFFEAWIAAYVPATAYVNF